MSQSIPTPSMWRMAIAVIAVIILVLFIMGFWNMVSIGSLGTCSAPTALVELLSILLAGSGAYLLYIQITRGTINEIALALFVTLAVVLAISLYSLSVSSFAGIC
ncbi:hypothetical protein [Vulcanisaeta thermophila]|uniref:hypothetical protein n=1 Tax=Vulcanisaeta thermophila TaxID=867917 RepID=UPI00117C9E26|nr:hypothetical protein [Vulcanisaeta thermophila]